MKHKVVFKNKNFSPFSKVRKSKLYVTAKQICSILQKNKFEAYIVGGAIRDLIIKPNILLNDLDIATSATPEDISRLFNNTLFVGESFGVSLVILNGMKFEIATFRKEGKYLDRRKPETISIGNFKDDANRRDFTVNCLYFNPLKNNIIDPHNGIQDIKNKQIRCVGNPENRLHEDALRILRMARFAANLNFSIAEETMLAAKKHSDGINLLSKERILLELKKIKLGKFFQFNKILNNTFNINNFFLDKNKLTKFEKSFLFKNKHLTGKIKIDSQYSFFNFMKHFLFYNELDENHYEIFLSTINDWPLSKDEKRICILFLKCVHLKSILPKNIEIEMLDFIFYELLSQINLITNNVSYEIFITISIFIKDNLLKETIYKMIINTSKNRIFNIDNHFIIQITEKYNLEKKYISAIIRYLHYLYLKKENISNFENIILFKLEFFQEYFKLNFHSTK